MRLSALQGFQLTLETYKNRHGTPDPTTESRTDFKDSDSSEYEHRLIAYSAEQESPIYISEKLDLSQNQPVTTNQVSFVDSESRRIFLIAVQLMRNTEIIEQWILDLRKALPQRKLKCAPPLWLLTDEGLMAVPTADFEEGPSTDVTFDHGNLLGENMNDSFLSTTSIQPTISSVMAESMTKASNLGGDIDDYVENEAPQKQPKATGSRILRWLPSWAPSDSTNTKLGDTKPEHLVSVSYSVLVDLWTMHKILDEARNTSAELRNQLDFALPSSTIPMKENEIQLLSKLRKMKRKLCAVHSETMKIKTRAAFVRKEQQKSKCLLNNSIEIAEARSSARRTSQNIRSKHTELESAKLPKLIKNEQARLASEIMEIFPIEALADGKFHFAIRGLVLPSVFAINHFDTAQVAAALGFVAQVVVCLSQYLDIPLPYSITICGSQSFIADHISLIKHGSVNFPLWTRGVLLYRVEYALYLLHKDIDQLMSNLGLAVADLKQTLANLQNLLLVVSSCRAT